MKLGPLGQFFVQESLSSTISILAKCLHVSHFVHMGIVMLGQVWAIYSMFRLRTNLIFGTSMSVPHDRVDFDSLRVM